MGPVKGNGKRSARGSAKRAQVIDAAVELFLSQGFDQTSMDAVAAQAGVSKATVYAHYGDKVGLFHAVVERAGAAFDLKLTTTGSGTEEPEEALRRLLVEVLGATTDPQALALIRILTIEGLRRPDLGRLLDESLWDELVGLAAALLEEDASRTGYDLPSPRTYALQLLRMASASLTLDCLLTPGFEPDSKLLETHAEWVVSLFLRGIRPRSQDGQVAAAPPQDYSYLRLPGMSRAAIQDPTTAESTPSRR